MSDKNDANRRFSEVAKLLGFETSYFSGMWRVRIAGNYVGQMSAEEWLAHIENCMIKAQRS